MEAEIYLDNNASTRVYPEALDAITTTLTTQWGNPSSAHQAGERGRSTLRTARESVAVLLGTSPEHVLFTSSGTSANNVVLRSITSKAARRCRIITTPVEHSSILRTCDALENEGHEIIYLTVDEFGLINLDHLAELLTGGADLVSIQWVNNETGTTQPIKAISSACLACGVPFHTDAAQATGKLPIKLDESAVSYLSFTGHKLHAPPGVGGLYAKEPKSLSPLVSGGPQELGVFAGTENLVGIAGLGKAAEQRSANLADATSYMSALRDKLETQMLSGVPEAKVNGSIEHRVCNTSNLQFTGLDGQAIVAQLDGAGIRVSQSSACTNMRPEPSYVLRAIGLTEAQAYSSIRFSVSVLNTEDEIDRAANKVVEVCSRLVKLQSRTSPAMAQPAEAT